VRMVPGSGSVAEMGRMRVVSSSIATSGWAAMSGALLVTR